MIENLQNHINEDIYKIAFEILDNYFNPDEIDDIVTRGVYGEQNNQSNSVFESTQQNVPDEGFSFH